MTARPFELLRSRTARALVSFAAFAALAAVLRCNAFLRSAFDWDESVYLLVSRALLDGHLPYTAVWDHKQPGIYFLFALGQALFGRGYLAARILSVIFVGATCVVLRRIGETIAGGDRRAGWLAAIVYAVYTTKSGGLSSNTEIFFAFPVALAFLLALRAEEGAGRLRRDPRRLLAVGILMGAAAQIKLLAAFDLVALVAWLAWAETRGRLSRLVDASRRLAPRIGWMAAGWIVPALLLAFPFAVTGHFGDYWYANVTANLTHASTTPFELDRVVERVGLQIAGNRPLWVGLAAAVLLAAVGIFRAERFRPWLGPVFPWTLAAFLSVLATKQIYDHYFLQMMPAVSLACGAALAGVARVAARRWRVAGAVLLLAALAGLAWREVVPQLRIFAEVTEKRQQTRDPYVGDEPAEVAAYLRGAMRPGDEVYVVDFEPVIYLLVETRIPTRYAFPPFLIDPHFAAVAGVDARRELASILSRAPRFLVRSRPGDGGGFYSLLDSSMVHYERARTFASCAVLRLREGEEEGLRGAMAAAR